MEAKDIVLAARKEYLEQSQDEQFKKAYEKVEELKRVIPEEDEEKDKKSLTPKAFNPDDHLVNYVMNKLLEVARKEGGNMFMGDSKDLYEYIFEFYTDYENLKDQFEDKWSQYIRGVGNTPTKKKKEETSDTSQNVDVEAIKKEAIKEYKEQEAKKKEEAKAKAEAEKEAKRKALEEAKKKEEEEANQNLGGLFDLL